MPVSSSRAPGRILSAACALVMVAGAARAESATTTDPIAAVIAAFDGNAEAIRREVARIPRSQATPPEAWVPRKLRLLVELDQLARRLSMAGRTPEEARALREAMGDRLRSIDEASTTELRSLIDRFGWITASRFGARADHDAWLLAQHADRDRALQRRVLALLEPLVAGGGTSPSNYAYLFDRVAVADGRPQRYGTQGRCVGPYRWEPHPLESPADVDRLRASVGLGPLEAYRKAVSAVCGPAPLRSPEGAAPSAGEPKEEREEAKEPDR